MRKEINPTSSQLIHYYCATLPSTTAISSSVNPFLRSQLIHQPIDLPVRRLDLALEHRLDVRRLLDGQPFVQVQHALHQADDPVVARDVGGVGEVSALVWPSEPVQPGR